jgi:3-hydroxyacyl-CoA dehydrogenase/enoyl-CoA hydratase/3-hydroxybutyryl-CoA epimerase
MERQADGRATLWLDVAGRSMNVLHRQLLAELDAALEDLAADTSLRVLVIRSGKGSGFAAGADLHEFPALRRSEQAMAFAHIGQQVLDKLERLPVPTVAVIQGPCLGGGLELALACDYRVVVQHPQTRLGLPEVELGLVPGWGGTQRLPLVVGLERALQMLLGRQRLDARQAEKCGLADALAGDEGEAAAVLTALLERALREGKRSRKKLPLRNWRQLLLESTAWGRWFVFRQAGKKLVQQVPDDMPAPAEALAVVRVGLRQGLAVGLAQERKAIGRLAVTAPCRNLVRLFLQHEETRRLPAEPRTASQIRRIGVVGAGTMGAGIVQLAALKGFEVVVQLAREEARMRGMARTQALFDTAVARGRLTAEEARARQASIVPTTMWQGFEDVDLAIETVIEDLEAKRVVFRELERHTRPGTVLLTNTSSLRVAQLQEGCLRPECVAGLHFFHPVHRIPLVEVVRGPATEEITLAVLAHWTVALGKTPLVVQDSPGFLVNRVLMPYINEALLLLEEGMPVERIDAVMRKFGMPLGPLEMVDQSGVDVVAHIARIMRSEAAERFPPNTAFEQLCELGWLGAKSGVGFYRYDGKAKRPNARAQALLRAGGPGTGEREACERMVGLMINEAADCLGRGVLTQARDIDLAMVLGTGWAPHRGGPLRYADERGLEAVCGTLEGLAGRLGPRFKPCSELRRRAAWREAFHDRDLVTSSESEGVEGVSV